MTAPKVIWVNTDNREDGCCPVEDTQYGNGRFYDHESATRYIRADAPELLALVSAASKVVSRCRVLSEYGQIGKWNEVSELTAALAACEAIAPKPATDALTPWGIQPDGSGLDPATLPIHRGGKASDNV